VRVVRPELALASSHHDHQLEVQAEPRPVLVFPQCTTVQPCPQNVNPPTIENHESKPLYVISPFGCFHASILSTLWVDGTLSKTGSTGKIHLRPSVRPFASPAHTPVCMWDTVRLLFVSI
jgi:hypothetical protein